jgi:hypothetical protein
MTFHRPRYFSLPRIMAAMAASLAFCAPLHAQARLVTDMSGATVEIKDGAPPHCRPVVCP